MFLLPAAVGHVQFEIIKITSISNKLQNNESSGASPIHLNYQPIPNTHDSSLPFSIKHNLIPRQKVAGHVPFTYSQTNHPANT